MKIDNLQKVFYHLRVAADYFADVARQSPGSLAAVKSKLYSKKLEWCVTDFITTPKLPHYAVDAFKKDVNGDVLFFEAISEKCAKLSPEQRANVETLVDLLLAGETIEAVIQ